MAARGRPGPVSAPGARTQHAPLRLLRWWWKESKQARRTVLQSEVEITPHYQGPDVRKYQRRDALLPVGTGIHDKQTNVWHEETSCKSSSGLFPLSQLGNEWPNVFTGEIITDNFTLLIAVVDLSCSCLDWRAVSSEGMVLLFNKVMSSGLAVVVAAVASFLALWPTSKSRCETVTSPFWSVRNSRRSRRKWLFR